MEQYVSGANGQIILTGGTQLVMPEQVVIQSGQTLQTQNGQVRITLDYICFILILGLIINNIFA